MFTTIGAENMIARINNLAYGKNPQWGKMNVAQMLAHCCVTYEFVYDNKHPKPSAMARFLMKLFVKPQVVGDKPYPRNSRTAPAFLVPAIQDFEEQKKRLINYITRTQQLGEQHFEGKESLSFGNLTSKEWNTMFAKHLDHHLTQFGV